MRTRKVNYLDSESKDGSFSPHIIEIEYVDADGGGITYISTKEQLKELINFASYKDGYEVLNIK